MHSDPLVPATLPTPVVAYLTGHSDRHIRHLVTTGALPADGGRRRRVPTVAVEELTGRHISALDYLRAERALDHPRERMRQYHNKQNMEQSRRDLFLEVKPGGHPLA